MIDPYLLSVMIFFSFLAVLIYKDRKNIDFNYVLIMKRTKRFRNILDRIAKKSPSFWKIVGSIAFIICLLSMVYGIYLILLSDYLVYTGVMKEPTIRIILPFPSETGVSGPGFIGIPFWFWIIVVATILIPHETFHGIIARAEKIKLKDVGLVLLILQYFSIPIVIIYSLYTQSFDFTLFLVALMFSIPGAFVEPDEKQLKKSKLITKLRVFSAGSFINIFIGLLVIVLVQNLIWAPNINGILITTVNETSPAGELGLKPGMVLESIDGREMTVDFFNYSFLVLMFPQVNTENVTKTISSLILLDTLKAYKPGEIVNLKVNGIDYELKLGEHPKAENFPYIGISYTELNTKNTNLFFILFPLLGMIGILNMLVGVFNILPIYPFDGGQIVKSITEKYVKKRSNQITLAITFLMLIILLYAVFGPYIHSILG